MKTLVVWGKNITPIRLVAKCTFSLDGTIVDWEKLAGGLAHDPFCENGVVLDAARRIAKAAVGKENNPAPEPAQIEVIYRGVVFTTAGGLRVRAVYGGGEFGVEVRFVKDCVHLSTQMLAALVPVRQPPPSLLIVDGEPQASLPVALVRAAQALADREAAKAPQAALL